MNLFKKTSSHWVRYDSYEWKKDDKAGHTPVNPVFLFPLYFVPIKMQQAFAPYPCPPSIPMSP